MKTKVVLACLPFFNHLFTPPIQLAYLKAYLQQNNEVEVKIIDLESYYFNSHLIKGNINLYAEKICKGEDCISKDIKNVLDEMVNLIISENPDVVGFSVTHPNYLFTQYVSQRIKEIKPEIYIIYGGLYFCYRIRWLNNIAVWHRNNLPFVDCIVKNEGEVTLMELVGSSAKGKRPRYCRGTTLRFGEKVIDCGQRPLIKDINSLPFPNFEDFSKTDYLGDYIRILFSRGCIGRCLFCSDNYQMCARLRSPQNVVDEIKLRIQQGYTRFQSCDLTLNPSTPHLEKICRLIIRENLKIQFVFGQLKHSRSLSCNTFSLLRKTGFNTICFGTESGSQTILNRMHKDVDIRTIGQNIKDAYCEGLDVILFFIVGFPGESEKTFQETLNWIKANARYIGAVKHVAPLAVNWGSILHANRRLYNLDSNSLFKNPDIWRTKDGLNNYPWRLDLSRRMIRYLGELGIPMVEFEGENPMVPKNIKEKNNEKTRKKQDAL